jgi:hypothetical protein
MAAAVYSLCSVEIHDIAFLHGLNVAHNLGQPTTGP